MIISLRDEEGENLSIKGFEKCPASKFKFKKEKMRPTEKKFFSLYSSWQICNIFEKLICIKRQKINI